MPARTARYSGSDRPAWRMNHTGVRSTGRRRIALTEQGAFFLERTRRLLAPAALGVPYFSHDR